jgi:Cu/Ag efflux protein CusF
LGLGGCERTGPGAGALPPADATYTTRGQIDALPTATGQAITIHHEAIPDFRSKAGEVVGMGSMAMPFMPAEGLDLGGLAAGDAITFTWEMRWKARPNSRIVKIEKLPAGTALNFGGAPGASK